MARGPVHTAYGVEVVDGRITVVRSRRERSGIVSSVLADGLDLSDQEVAAVLSEIKSATDRQRAFVSAGFPAGDSFVRVIEAPFPSVKKATAVFPSLLDIQLPFPLEQCAYRFAHIHKAENGSSRAVAAGVPIDRLEQFLDTLKQTGIDPEWVEQESMALWRYSLRTDGAGSARPRAVLYLDKSRTVMVAGANGLPATSFSMKRAWSPSDAEAAIDQYVVRIKQQIAAALGSSHTTAPIFTVCGPGAEGDLDLLRSRLAVDDLDWRVAGEPRTFLARALAHGVLEPDTWRVNLRFGASAHPHIARLENKSRSRVFAAAAVMLAFAVVGSVLSVYSVKQHHAALQRELQEKARELTGLTVVPRGQEVFVARQHAEGARESYRAFNAWYEPTAYPLFKDILEAARAVAATMDTVAVQPASLIVKGTCADWNDPERIGEICRKRNWNVAVERRDAGADERVHFTLRAQP